MGIAALIVLLVLVLLAVLFCFLGQVPKNYPPMAKPIEPPSPTEYTGREWTDLTRLTLATREAGMARVAQCGEAAKVPDLDKEAGMGLRWTFMPVYWSAMEPDGPVDLSASTPAAWRELDSFVIEAQRRRLNILMQAPVVGGNAGGPPGWAGRRERGQVGSGGHGRRSGVRREAGRAVPQAVHSVLRKMGNALRHSPWELDNEPESYLTHWEDQAGDYAELATKVCASVKQADPRAFLLLPATAGGPSAWEWTRAALGMQGLSGSAEFRRRGIAYSIGPLADGVSFHIYEGLNVVFSSSEETVELFLENLRSVFNEGETATAAFPYARKREYWHTEGNFDFIGWLSTERREPGDPVHDAGLRRRCSQGLRHGRLRARGGCGCGAM